MGFQSLDSMLQLEPDKIPFEKCKGLGPAKSKKMRAILKANRSQSPLKPPESLIPSKKHFELYVDYEYFTNVNVDFERQWPTLEGCEMIFMIGVGWENQNGWSFKTFIAEEEDQEQECKMFERFIEFLQTHTAGEISDDTKIALYHWTSAEVWQTTRAADRHQLPDTHPIRKLPWYDLQKLFLEGPSSVPGAWDYGLKEIAKALGKLNPEFEPHWPGNLDQGLRAMVMGWKAYEKTQPLESEEMETIIQYIEADCSALWKIMKWIRS